MPGYFSVEYGLRNIHRFTSKCQSILSVDEAACNNEKSTRLGVKMSGILSCFCHFALPQVDLLLWWWVWLKFIIPLPMGVASSPSQNRQTSTHTHTVFFFNLEFTMSSRVFNLQSQKGEKPYAESLIGRKERRKEETGHYRPWFQLEWTGWEA